MDETLRTAGDLLGTRLHDPVDLGGSPRSTVLRCRTDEGGTVVVKAFEPEPDSLRGFGAEAAGLALGLAGPRLLGVAPDAARPLLVMADLGTAPTLADLLLGDDPKAAVDALLAWSRGLGRLAAGSVGHREEFVRATERYAGGRPLWSEERWVEKATEQLWPVLARLGVDAPPGLAGELAEIAGITDDPYQGFTPGDTCPDNNLITPQGLELIDFETCGYQSVFLTAAYCRMPFSTCWCVFELPEQLAQEIEDTYRAEVTGVFPALAEDAVWEAGVRRAVAAWTVNATTRLTNYPPEQAMHRSRRPVASAGQVLAHRWRTAEAVTGVEFPAYAETMRRLLEKVASGWDLPRLPGYPALS
ncbi:hypothetical protein [Kitasatospora camelliae]|uniref:Phosphotransferase family enzyme n=1 Tax=Kitasatospora camelliae TaxID=3156397 RepID=A0AAU8K530_9ACTN